MQDIAPWQFVKQFLAEYCADIHSESEMVNLLEMQVMLNPRLFLRAKKEVATLLHQEENAALENLILAAAIPPGALTGKRARAWLEWLVTQMEREITENLLPFQPIRAKLQRNFAPQNEKFPHDLLLYPTDEALPELWKTEWAQDVFYTQFLREWDGETCPACRTPTVKRVQEKRYKGETDITPYNARIEYDTFWVYRCTRCRHGWTERRGTEIEVDVNFP